LYASIFRELLARLLVQNRFINFAAKTKCKFAPFNFSRIADLRFDRNGADHRHPVAAVGDALQIVDQEMLLVVEAGAALEPGSCRVAKLPDVHVDALLVQERHPAGKLRFVTGGGTYPCSPVFSPARGRTKNAFPAALVGSKCGNSCCLPTPPLEQNKNIAEQTRSCE